MGDTRRLGVARPSEEVAGVLLVNGILETLAEAIDLDADVQADETLAEAIDLDADVQADETLTEEITLDVA